VARHAQRCSSLLLLQVAERRAHAPFDLGVEPAQVVLGWAGSATFQPLKRSRR
jgi:hypothetical protein